MRTCAAILPGARLCVLLHQAGLATLTAAPAESLGDIVAELADRGQLQPTGEMEGGDAAHDDDQALLAVGGEVDDGREVLHRRVAEDLRVGHGDQGYRDLGQGGAHGHQRHGHDHDQAHLPPSRHVEFPDDCDGEGDVSDVRYHKEDCTTIVLVSNDEAPERR